MRFLGVDVISMLWDRFFRKKRKYREHIHDMKMTTKDTRFLSIISHSFNEDDFVVVYISYAGGAGAEDYFLVNSIVELEKILAKVKPWDRVCVFTKKAIPIRGHANIDLKTQALTILFQLQAKDSVESIVAVKTDSGHTPLSWGDDWVQLDSSEKVEEWFTKNTNAPVIIFPPAWVNDEVIEALGSG